MVDSVKLLQGRYQIVEPIARGGMGAVYLAEDTRLPGRWVAIKENLESTPGSRQQFEREAVILARLRHPNLPQVTDFFVEANGQQYLVMEYIPGQSLQQLLQQRGALPVAEVIEISHAVMAALAYMHTWRDPKSGQPRPIIHRDVKPANIKRTPDGRIMLVDFGIAKVDTDTATALSARALTPGYAPLEQYHGGTDERSDIYALGATLYALLTGRTPPSATSLATGAPLPPPQTINGAVPKPVAAAVLHAMQQLPADRFQSVAEMQRALGSAPASGGAAQKTSPSTAHSQRAQRPARTTVVALALLLSGLAGVLAIGVLLVTPQPAAMPTPATIMSTPRMTPSGAATKSVAFGAETPESASISRATATATRSDHATAATTVVVATPSPTPTPKPRPTATATRTPVRLATATAAAVVANLQAASASLAAVLQPDAIPPAAGAWAVLATKGVRDNQQTWVKSAVFPGDAIRAKWQEGYDVTLLTYGDGAWVFVATQLPDNPQQYFTSSHDFPGDIIRAKWREGYDVTSIAYGGGLWGLVMTKHASSLEQAFAREVDFPGDRIRRYWAEGYDVTSLAYGAGAWAVIVSKLPDDPMQRYATSVEFPGQAITSLWAEGFDITVLTYGGGLWAYVAAVSDTSVRQTYFKAAEFPSARITALWADGYDVTGLAYGRD